MNDGHDLIPESPLLLLGQRGPSKGIQLVSGDDGAWFVEQGNVDVFLVANNVETGTGAREHLFSVGTGQLLTFPPLSARDTEALAIVPGPDTQYRTIARNELLNALATLAQPDLAALLNQLVENTASGFSESVPAGSQQLEAGTNATCPDETCSFVSAAAHVWVELAAGQASFLGRTALEAARLVPIPPTTWLTLAPGSAVRTHTTADVMARASHSDMLDAIDGLFLMLFHSAVRQRQKNEADELNRLQLKREIGSKAMSDALGNFVSLFNASETEDVNAEGTDYLLSGCRIIGARIGISFRAAPPSASGARSRDPVKDIAQASAVRTRIVALKGAWWLDDNGPLLVFPEQGRTAFALLPVRRGGYEAVEARTGERSKVTAQFTEGLRPFAYTFYAALPSKKLALFDILRFVSLGIRPDIVTVIAIAFASALLAMAIPIASGHLFDNVFPAAERGQMGQVVLILFIASLVTLLFEATRSLAMLRIEGKASSDLQAAVWDRVLSLPVPFFRNFSSGDLATRINGINEIRQALSGPVIASLISNAFSALNVILLFHYSVTLAFVAILLVSLAITVNMVLGYLSVRVWRETSNVYGKLAGLVLEYLSGITKLRITGSESRAFANWAAQFAEQKRLALRGGGLASLSGTFNATFPVMANALLFACIATALADDEILRFSTGDFIAFSVAWSIFLGSALSLVKTGINLLSVGATYERTKPILETMPEVDESKPYPGTLAGAIEVSNVRFAYAPDTPLILDDVSISIKPGEFVALVGSSGSGKSTLLRLMLGFEKPSHGGIYYDDHHLEEVDIGAVRRQIGVVLQGGRLMSGSIFTNIIGSASLTLDDAWEAARACGLDQDINAMPMGMHTLLSDGAGTLSGGQRQRLLIARAIVNKPRVLYFDEATSALDNKSQAIVSASMENLKATRVVIAHRLSTIINADRIYVLDKGKVVQSGSYDQLISQQGLFAELAKRQMT